MRGYSGTPLVKKLGFKDGYDCIFYNLPDHYFGLLEGLPEINVLEEITHPEVKVDFIHAFVQTEQALLEIWVRLKERLKKTGMMWISWPKGSSKLPKDINETFVRTTGLNGGLVDVKICAVDDDWSGLKFMFRKKDR